MIFLIFSSNNFGTSGTPLFEDCFFESDCLIQSVYLTFLLSDPKVHFQPHLFISFYWTFSIFWSLSFWVNSKLEVNPAVSVVTASRHSLVTCKCEFMWPLIYFLMAIQFFFHSFPDNVHNIFDICRGYFILVCTWCCCCFLFPWQKSLFWCWL